MKQEQPKVNKWLTVKRLWGYVAKYRASLILVLVLNVVANLLSLTGPALAGRAMNSLNPVTGRVLFDKLLYYCVLMMILYLASSILSYILTRLMIVFSQKIISSMRKDVFDKFSELPVGFFDTHQTGELISRITYDIDTINSSLTNDVITITTGIITIVGSLAMMLWISPLMLLIFLVPLPLSCLFSRYMARKMRPLFKKRSVKLGEMNGYMEEIISGHMTIKAYNREDVIISRFDRKNKQAVDAYYDTEFNGGIVGPSNNFINNISLSVIGLFGTIMFLTGRLDIGGISSFVLYSRKFSGPISEIANISSEIQSALSAADRVFALLDEPVETPDLPDCIEPESIRGEIEFRNINFGYDKSRTILKDFSFIAKEGSVSAIVGPTGAGKTTIINLLMRFYDPDSGQILLDGNDIRNFRRKDLRKAFTMVLQDTWLFNGTVADNIAYAKEDATPEEIREVAAAAKIHSFVSRLRDQYDTVLSDDGFNISGGQRQLLTIARAMLANAQLLILDEATSNVDTQTEIQIRDAMLRLMKGKTCFVIAHRLSTIVNADNILVIKDGNIVEQGSHSELMGKGGFYSEMFNAQFAKFI
ncbi:MAG: ABC transporter ATP-binding protein [Saccharofermentanales bacterium]